ncbi:unnamed protein product [Peronospora destructor]|uniref:BED-type domain-containing protein n=1 Tax=Peronospora destructor TaxID=86335 RepID=A0AAV0V6F1_9STRA|nr:unnamed protein product [Peronospora destructor]
MLDKEHVGEKRHRAGRRPSSVWAFFTEIRRADNKVYARCNFCPKRLAAVASRMRQHVLSKCSNAPTDITRLLDEAFATSATVQSVVPNSVDSATDFGATAVIDSDTMEIPRDSDRIVDAVPSSSVVKRRKNEMKSDAIQQVHPSDDEDKEGSLGLSEENTTMFKDKAEEIVAGKETNVANDRRHDEPEDNGEDAVGRVYQKLVLACVLNDIPATFVEDEALMEAFALARPGLPRLSAEEAQTTVFQELADEVTKKMEQHVASCEVLTLVHRHVKKSHTGNDTGTSSKWCDRWVGVDEHRKVFPLKETYREVKPLSSCMTDANCCRYCTPREAFDTVVSTYRLSLAPEAVFCLCCDCPQVYQQMRLEQELALSTSIQDADTVSELAAKSKTQMLLSTCLVRLSFMLRKELLNTFPAVINLLNKAIFLAHSVSKITPLRPQLESLLESSSWDAVPRLVKRMVYLESDIRRYQAKVSVPAEEVASFWNKLRVANTLLTPFNWMLALSEAKEATSAQYIVLWLWLLAIVESTTSSLLPEQEKECFVSTAMSLIGHRIDSHELVCMFLDPRVAGAGLSISGKRRVKSMVVQVAERVFPSEGFGTGAARSQLLNQLSDYAEKAGSFADIVAWEMSAGRPPKLFWNDFVEDAPHLARVAHAVISVTPYAQTAVELLNPPLPAKEFLWEQTFAVQQLKFQARNTSPQSTCGIEQYHSLLFPPSPLPQGSVSDGTLSIEVDKALRVNNTPRWSASDETEVEAIVTHQLSLILKVGSDNDIDVNQMLSTPPPAPNNVSLSWFACQSINDLKILEQTVKNFLSCPPAVNII